MDPHQPPRGQSGAQPQGPQQIPQPSRQVLVHSPTCPITAMSRAICAHEGASPLGCASCEAVSHCEGARSGWLRSVCICVQHNPTPRMDTPAGRHRLMGSLQRTGAREMEYLVWARDTIRMLAEGIDQSLERVLQARVPAAGPQPGPAAENDLRIINEAGALMRRILPDMGGVHGDFWLEDGEIAIPAQGFSPPQRGQASPEVIQQAREARLAFERFKKRTENGLEFLGLQDQYFEDLVGEDRYESYDLGEGYVLQPAHRTKYQEATSMARESLREKQPQEHQQAQQQAQQARPLVIHGPQPNTTTGAPPAPGTATHQPQQQASPLVVNGSAPTPTAPGSTTPVLKREHVQLTRPPPPTAGAAQPTVNEDVPNEWAQFFNLQPPPQQQQQARPPPVAYASTTPPLPAPRVTPYPQHHLPDEAQARPIFTGPPHHLQPIPFPPPPPHTDVTDAYSQMDFLPTPAQARLQEIRQQRYDVQVKIHYAAMDAIGDAVKACLPGPVPPGTGQAAAAATVAELLRPMLTQAQQWAEWDQQQREQLARPAPTQYAYPPAESDNSRWPGPERAESSVTAPARPTITQYAYPPQPATSSAPWWAHPARGPAPAAAPAQPAPTQYAYPPRPRSRSPRPEYRPWAAAAASTAASAQPQPQQGPVPRPRAPRSESHERLRELMMARQEKPEDVSPDSSAPAAAVLQQPPSDTAADITTPSPTGPSAVEEEQGGDPWLDMLTAGDDDDVTMGESDDATSGPEGGDEEKGAAELQKQHQQRQSPHRQMLKLWQQQQERRAGERAAARAYSSLNPPPPPELLRHQQLQQRLHQHRHNQQQQNAHQQMLKLMQQQQQQLQQVSQMAAARRRLHLSPPNPPPPAVDEDHEMPITEPVVSADEVRSPSSGSSVEDGWTKVAMDKDLGFE